MNHFNFFENANKEKKGLNIPLISAFLFVCAALVLGGMYLSAEIKLASAKKQLDYLVSVESDAAFKKQYSEEKSLENSLNSAENDYVFLRTAELLVKDGTTVDDGMIKTVFSYFPKGMAIEKMTVSYNSITIDGVAKNLQSLINVEKKLRASEYFSYVFVTTAKEDTHTGENGEDAITFNCKLIYVQKGSGD